MLSYIAGLAGKYEDSIIDQTFEKLQAEVSNAVDRIYLDKKSPLMVRPAYWWHVFQQVMVLMVTISFLLYILVPLLPLSPNVWQRLGWFVGVIFPGKLGNFLFAAFVVFATVLVVGVLPLYLIYEVKFRILRELLNGIYRILLMPIGFGFSLWFVYDLLIERTSLVSFLGYWVVSLNIFSWFITTLLVFSVSLMPHIFFFVFISPINQEQKTFIPSFDQIVFQVIERVKEKDVFKNLHLDHIDTLRGMAQRKQASLGIQSQTVASVVTTFSLFGLVAVLFTQEELRWFLGEIERWLGPEFSGSMIWILVIGFLGLTFFPLRYFFRVLVAVRVLDIVIELIEMRAKELQAATATDGEFVLRNGIYVPKQSIGRYRSGAEEEKARRG